jgi:hypothetical protein
MEKKENKTVMSIMSRLMARLYKLPPAETHDIAVEKGLEAPIPGRC